MFNRILFITSVSLLGYTISFGQSVFPYEEEWKMVDSLINKKKLPQSALIAVNRIYEAAKKDKNEGQWVRAIIYKNDLRESGDQDMNKEILAQENEISIAPPRVAAVLKSLEAADLNQFLLSYGYRFKNRTEIILDTATDILTWTNERLTRKIQSLYLGSIALPASLKTTPLDVFDAILIKGNVRELRPTLYDFLAWRALDYFREDRRAPNISADDSLWENPLLFSEAPLFMHSGFPNTDTSSHLHFALGIYQDLLRFHSKDIQPDAWLDADISRIQFVYQYAKMDDRDALYIHALRRITSQFATISVVSQAYYLQARWWANQAEMYNPIGDTAHRFDYLKSVEICKQAINHSDSSEGKSNCEALLKNILQHTYNINIEQVNLPDLPFRALVTYKNIPHLYGRIIRLNETSRNLVVQNEDRKEFWHHLIHLQYERTLTQDIPETKDYQEHRVEIKMEPLPIGQYALLTSSDSTFSDQAIIGLTTFFCSSIAYVKNGDDYFVVDRNTGHPLQGVKVRTYDQHYANGISKFTTLKNYQTDLHGFFQLAAKKNYSNQKLEFFYGKDYFTEVQYGGYYRNNDLGQPIDEKEYEKNQLNVNFYADRSIYRPGQTVYFKALFITKDFHSRKFKVVNNRQTKIYLIDANDQPTDSVVLKSNDFGAVNASFKLPQNLLNGEFRLQDSMTETELPFSVEEYKRPTFYIEYDTLKNAYQMGDTVNLPGSALAYAGNRIDGAKLTYRVYRETRFPYPWLFRFRPENPNKEIAHGEASTDKNGQFNIRFVTRPDQQISRSAKPVYTYRIETTVTDGNGESRSETTTVSASYQSFEIVSSIPDRGRIPADSLYQLSVITNNTSGYFIKKSLTVSIYSLRGPDRLIRSRYWTQPDQFIMTEPDYLKSFPNDEYRNETDITSWAKREMIFVKTDSTRADGLFELGKKLLTSLLPGWYLIEFKSRDKDGEDIINKKFVEITADGKKSGVLTYNLNPDESIMAEPGKKVTIHFGSDAEDLFLIRTKNTMTDTTNDYSFFNLSSGMKNTMIDIREADRGGFALNDVFVKNNRWYSSEHLIQVPWTNKELNISYQTWKDKTLPGSKEQWKIKITGTKKDQLASEVLTSMYDASLDQFRVNSWAVPSIYPVFDKENVWDLNQNFISVSLVLKQNMISENIGFYENNYDRLIISESGRSKMLQGVAAGISIRGNAAASPLKKERTKDAESDKNSTPKVVMTMFTPPKIETDDETRVLPDHEGIQNAVQIRKNFNETAFFQPDLKTDSQGNVEIRFTMPDALTRWKWMLLANTRDLSFGYSEKMIVTQKELMLQTNMPRFFREGDTMLLPVKISNLSAQNITGTVELQWLDANTNQPVNEVLGNLKSNQPFHVTASQSAVVFFPAMIPAHFTRPLLYRLIAKSDNKETNYSDGEENIIPVLSNRMLVTESLPLNMNGKTNEHFVFDKLLNSGKSNSLQNEAVTVEYTTNPAWYAAQSIPYLMEFPYECAEQTFNRFYANALAGHIVKMTPALQAIFEKWKNTDTAALLSNLQKNEELKTVLLNETPWVLEAQTEAQQKKNMALLFDLIRLQRALKSALGKLQQMQSEDGGFAWFKGGRSDRYITQYIISGIGHLKKLKVYIGDLQPQLDKIIQSGISYLDREIKTDYDRRDKTTNPQNLSSIQIQYLYMRSFFPDLAVSGSLFPAINYYRKLSIGKWMNQPVYMQGMIALFLNRSGDIKTSKDILASLKENASASNELGMYFKSVRAGYYWQEAPVETQSLLIEVFQELKADNRIIDQLKYWLLLQKRTNQWSTTKATADACYALLLNGSDWLSSTQTATIQLGNYSIGSIEKAEAGTGYFKERIPGDQVKADMGNISVTLDRTGSNVNLPPPTINRQPPTTSPSWGAVYWQYFEYLDKMTGAQTQLSVNKYLFIQKKSDKGPVLEPVSPATSLKTGDKLIMRIIIRSDRDLEYVHLKDMRAACLEPVNVLSGYQWQDGQGYYQTTKDAATSFFFDHLPKGTFVLEYPVYVTTAGNYSNGISSLGCMYAPEFAAHSEGIRIHVESK